MTRLLQGASMAAILCAALSLPATSASTRNLRQPSINRISGRISLPKQDSATLALPVMNWLRSQGLTYVIPGVPGGFPPVKPMTAARAAAMHTPVGSYPVIRGLALISPLTPVPPLSIRGIVWAVVLSARGSPSDVFYVTFVEVYKPTVIGWLFHAQ